MAKSADDARESTMRYLVMHVARAFYDTRFVVILDQLARHEVLKDDELAGRCGMNSKELMKYLGVLLKDGLITVYRQNTSRTGETNARVISKGYFYIDHAPFCNIVKWRMAEMRRLIDDKLRNELAQQGYVCPQCRKTFQTLDVQNLIGPGGLFCDQCGDELTDNQNKDDIAGNEDRMQRFNAQTQRILDGLKKTEEMIMPKVDILDWIKKHPTIALNADGEALKDDGLAIAGAKPGVTQKQVYEVVLTADDNGEQDRMAREKEASARRQQNAMPSWHTRSTVTGDLTSFGLKNAANAAGGSTIENRNLRLLEDHEDQKNAIEMYYADLEAQNKASQAQSPMDVDGPVPDELGTPIRPPARGGTGLSVPSLDSTTSINRTYSVSSLKRKLDASEFADDGTRSKQSRSTSYQSSPPSPVRSKSRDSNATSSSTSESARGDTRMVDNMGKGASLATVVPEEPMVLVRGQPMPLSQITNEHQELMTEEEYETYGEVMSAA